MRTLNYLLLAVRNPLESAKLYDQLLGFPPVESSPMFVLYVMPNGFKLGLWAASDVEPKAKPPGGVELSFSLPDESSVRKIYAAWKELGLEVVQEPTRMDFGFTFVVADPDGHRLRPFVLAEDPR